MFDCFDIYIVYLFVGGNIAFVIRGFLGHNWLLAMDFSCS